MKAAVYPYASIVHKKTNFSLLAEPVINNFMVYTQENKGMPYRKCVQGDL